MESQTLKRMHHLVRSHQLQCVTIPCTMILGSLNARLFMHLILTTGTNSSKTISEPSVALTRGTAFLEL